MARERERGRGRQGGPPPGAAVRPAGVPDAEAVATLRADMLEHHARLDPRFRPTSGGRLLYRSEFLRWLTDPTYQVLVAESEGRVVGYIVGTVQVNPSVIQPRHIGYITDICVEKGERRHGLGRMLVEAVMEWFRERGLRVIQLRASSRNPDSQAFWRRMGWDDFMTEMWYSLDEG